MRKAFTLIELVVAMGILALILSFAGVIFRAGTGAQRMAMANAEIMEKLRVITSQLDTDFKGMIGQYGGWSATRTITWTNDTGDSVTTNWDGLGFLANGDFQSTRQYGGDTIVGNVASIFYGPPDPNSYKVPGTTDDIVLPAPRDRILLRRQTILAPEAPGADSRSDGEYYCASLEQWRNEWEDNRNGWYRQSIIDPANIAEQMPMLLAKGVDNFTVEFIEHGTSLGTAAIPWVHELPGQEFSPVAFKVTFTLYDSKGVLAKGRTFTHIVLVGG